MLHNKIWSIYFVYIVKKKFLKESKELVLELDHINGNNRDHRPNNLRFLCPNCHSQTPTWGNRGNKGNKKKVKL
jgi:5-methylcytosine-specific restriction endonuclease McrA